MPLSLLIDLRSKPALPLSLALAAAPTDNSAMPRTARAAVGGDCYHVLNRGNRRGEVFHGPDDYAAFVRLAEQATARIPLRVLGWCLIRQ